jgi:hypothetical protein
MDTIAIGNGVGLHLGSVLDQVCIPWLGDENFHKVKILNAGRVQKVAWDRKKHQFDYFL